MLLGDRHRLLRKFIFIKCSLSYLKSLSSYTMNACFYDYFVYIILFFMLGVTCSAEYLHQSVALGIP